MDTQQHMMKWLPAWSRSCPTYSPVSSWKL